MQFFERHGGKSVFIGRFLGPIRAVIPLAAGIMQMPRGRFWIDPVTGRVAQTELLIDSAGVNSTITAVYRSQPKIDPWQTPNDSTPLGGTFTAIDTGETISAVGPYVFLEASLTGGGAANALFKVNP